MAERILLVCDNPRELQLIWLALHPAGLEMDAALTSQDGLFLARLTAYQAIIVDLSAWEREGLDLCGHLRAVLGERPVPLIGVSAHAMKEEVARAQQAGCDFYLTKPLDLARMARMVLDLLDAG